MKRLATFLLWLATSLFWLLLVGFFVFSSTAAQTGSKGKYSNDVYLCIEKARQGQARTIENFVCPEGVSVDQDIAYQVILDQEFKKLDDEVMQDLRSLQNQQTKDVLVLNDKIKTWFDATSPNPKYFNRYRSVCHDINQDGNPLREAIAVFSGGVTTDSATANFVQGEAKCDALVQAKMDAYRDIALLIATGNVVGSYSNDKEKFTAKLKDQYEKFLNEWMIYIGELARIQSKWTAKIKTQNHE